MEIKAKVTAVLPLEEKKGKNGAYKVATIIVEYLDGDYPHKVALTNIKKADAFGSIAVGSTGTFNINLNSREYQNRWYTTCDCWSWWLDKNTTKEKSAPAQPKAEAKPQAAPVNAATQAVDDDGGLPF